MVCIAAFLVLLVISIFSAKHRKLLKKAWYCVTRRVTFRKCDTTFGEDVKNSILAPLAIKAPQWVKPASIAITTFAWVLVATTVISLYVLFRSGLFLAVYGTCNPQRADACVLAAASCSIGVEHPSFSESLFRGDIIGAIRNEATDVADAFATIPSRFVNWNPDEFLPPFASFKDGYSQGQETILEIIDPGCGVCAQLFINIGEAGLDQVKNLSYLVYPIMNGDVPQFQHSVTISNLLTAIRIFEHTGSPTDNPTDWLLLERIFTGFRPGTDVTNQFWFNELASVEAADQQLRAWLAEFGYTDEQIADVFDLANSQQVADIIAAGRIVVREDIRTVTIPTLLIPGTMHRGLVSVDRLQP
jgi:hypothetical protein